jgi:hypothetical protein
MENKTITFDEKVKGWTSFHSFIPEYLIGMNSNFYTFKNGELYLHNSDSVPRNTFYGVQYPSKISMMVNDSPADIKELQAVSLEGNSSWNALITAYVSGIDDNIKSSIKDVEFIKKEGIWYAYARRNESTASFDSKSTYGIGVVTLITGNVVKVNGGNALITSGDLIIKGSNLSTIGNITQVSTLAGVTTLTLDSATGLTVGDFLVGQKDSRVEGGNLRGYTLRIDLEVNKDSKVELFSVNSEVIKSFS